MISNRGGIVLALAHGLKLPVPSALLCFVVPAVTCRGAALPLRPPVWDPRKPIVALLLSPLSQVYVSEALSLSLITYSVHLAGSDRWRNWFYLFPPVSLAKFGGRVMRDPDSFGGTPDYGIRNTVMGAPQLSVNLHPAYSKVGCCMRQF